MSDVALVPISWIRSAAFAVAALIILVAFQFCRRPDPSGLPPGVQTSLVDHQVRSVVDTAEKSRLDRVAHADSVREAEYRAEVRHARAAAQVASTRADSFAAIAASAQSAADSAEAWRQAYIDEKLAGDSLRAAAAHADVATEIADRRADTTRAAEAIETRRADRADKVITQLVPLAENREGCRIPGTFGLVACPSRTALVVGGAVAVVAGVVVGYEAGKGNLKASSLPGLSQVRVNVPLLTIRF